MRTRRMEGFSLVELLVVIAVIAILAGIMLPVASSLRESSRRAACNGQLRQVVMAIKGFAASQDGNMPPMMNVGKGVKSGMYQEPVNSKGPWVNLGELWNSGEFSKEIFVCPSANGAFLVDSDYNDNNNRFLSSYQLRLPKVVIDKSSAMTVSVLETFESGYGELSYSDSDVCVVSDQWGHKNTQIDGETARWSHGNYFNVAFGDGRVKGVNDTAEKMNGYLNNLDKYGQKVYKFFEGR